MRRAMPFRERTRAVAGEPKAGQGWGTHTGARHLRKPNAHAMMLVSSCRLPSTASAVMFRAAIVRPMASLVGASAVSGTSGLARAPVMLVACACAWRRPRLPVSQAARPAGPFHLGCQPRIACPVAGCVGRVGAGAKTCGGEGQPTCGSNLVAYLHRRQQHRQGGLARGHIHDTGAACANCGGGRAGGQHISGCLHAHKRGAGVREVGVYKPRCDGQTVSLKLNAPPHGLTNGGRGQQAGDGSEDAHGASSGRRETVGRKRAVPSTGAGERVKSQKLGLPPCQCYCVHWRTGGA